MAASDVIEVEDLPRNIVGELGEDGTPESGKAEPEPAEPTLEQLREQWLAPLQTRYLTDLLRRCDGNVAGAAMHAGVNTVTLYRLLEKRGLELSKTVR